MKRWLIALAVIAAIGSVFWAIHVRREARKRYQRQVQYETALARYSAMFHPGMLRKDVESRLAAGKVEYSAICCGPDADIIELGREYDVPWYCSYEAVYVTFEFDRNSPKPFDPDPSGKLRSVQLWRRLGDCL